MKLTVKYFAALRDERRLDEELLDLDCQTPEELYEHLKKVHGLSLCRSKLKVAVNDEFADWTNTLCAADVVVFIPPVAGG
jgi:molybdopterin converting factor subunit 1